MFSTSENQDPMHTCTLDRTINPASKASPVNRGQSNCWKSTSYILVLAIPKRHRAKNHNETKVLSRSANIDLTKGPFAWGSPPNLPRRVYGKTGALTKQLSKCFNGETSRHNRPTKRSKHPPIVVSVGDPKGLQVVPPMPVPRGHPKSLGWLSGSGWLGLIAIASSNLHIRRVGYMQKTSSKGTFIPDPISTCNTIEFLAVSTYNGTICLFIVKA